MTLPLSVRGETRERARKKAKQTSRHARGFQRHFSLLPRRKTRSITCESLRLAGSEFLREGVTPILRSYALNCTGGPLPKALKFETLAGSELLGEGVLSEVPREVLPARKESSEQDQKSARSSTEPRNKECLVRVPHLCKCSCALSGNTAAKHTVTARSPPPCAWQILREVRIHCVPREIAWKAVLEVHRCSGCSLMLWQPGTCTDQYQREKRPQMVQRGKNTI